ncbi:MAG: phage tail tape measure protein [Parvibaculum sp.]|nr:phage tail tape measure protein [Parvibaculum sp.]
MSNFSIKVVIKAVDNFTAEMSRITKSAENMGRSMKRIGAGLTVGVTAPLAALAATSLTAFSDFQAGMSNVSTLVNTATESMSAMSKETLAISTRVPVALGDITGALYDIRSANISAADAMGVLEGSARLAVAGIGTVKEATDLVTSSINAFNLKGADQAKLYDNIFKAVKNGKTTIAELAQGFGAVASTVSGAGIKIDEYLAAVAAITTTGIPAAQAHTQLRAAIVGMTRESDLGNRVLKKLVASTFNDLISKSGGVVNAFTRINKVLGGNKAALISLLGSEGYNSVFSLTGNQNEAFTSTLYDMRDGANAVDEAFTKQSENFKNSMQRTQNQVGRLQVIVGEALAPAIMKVANLIGRLADWFSELSPKAQKIVLVVAALTAGLGPLLIALGFVVTAIAAISAPVLIAIGAIVLLSAAIATAVIYWDDIKAAAVGAFETIMSWAGKAYDFLKPVLDAIGFIARYSRVGLAVRAGMAVASAVTSDAPAATAGKPSLATRARGGPAAKPAQSELTVKFENAPPGTRVGVDKATPGMSVATDVGMNMGAN